MPSLVLWDFADTRSHARETDVGARAIEIDRHVVSGHRIHVVTAAGPGKSGTRRGELAPLWVWRAPPAGMMRSLRPVPAENGWRRAATAL